MDTQSHLDEVRQAAFEDELNKIATGKIPPAQIKAAPSAKARVESRFKGSPIGRAAATLLKK